MIYNELAFTVESTEDFHKDLLINSLSEIGFDTFEETEQGFNAYIPSDAFDQELLAQVTEAFEGMFAFSYRLQTIPAKNWNEVWESNFTPITISDQCFVRATFHEARPEFPYEIVIDPKMSFGTGHHQTTAMMMEYMLEEEFAAKRVLDMGCGTGILAILAAKMNALQVTAIDYDQLCFDSTIENSSLNGQELLVLKGSKEAIPTGQLFDIILANINRNILLDQMESYARVLAPGGTLLLSGFYKEPDLDLLIEKAGEFDIEFVNHKIKDQWVAARFVEKFR